MGFFTGLLDAIFGTPAPSREEMSRLLDQLNAIQAERMAQNQPPPPEPIDWPRANETRLSPSGVPPMGGSTSEVPPEIVAVIREEVDAARLRDTSSEIKFQRGGPPPRPSDPLFNDFYSLCKPRAFTDRIRQRVREVYEGDAVPFYRAAGISRSAYSRLISHPERHPSKDTALAMAAALKFDEEGADEFLELAGYALSPSYPEDVVWRMCFRYDIHDLATIRAFLREVCPPPPPRR